MNMKKSIPFILILMLLPGLAAAATVKGRIKYISNKASTIQLDVKGKEPVVVQFDSTPRCSKMRPVSMTSMRPTC